MFYHLPDLIFNASRLVVLIFEGAFCHERKYYVLRITIYLTIILLNIDLKQFNHPQYICTEGLEVTLKTYYVLL